MRKSALELAQEILSEAPTTKSPFTIKKITKDIDDLIEKHTETYDYEGEYLNRAGLTEDLIEYFKKVYQQ